MQIIVISRGSFSGGKRFAERLAEQLGYDCVAREELVDGATSAGIPVGKLEMAVVRRRPLSEQLRLVKERYAAFVTMSLCERVLNQSLVYHGRTGHLALTGVTHALRIRVIRDPEQRIATTMERLRVSRPKAQTYVEQVDEDRRRWARTLYNIDWQDPQHYDVVANLSRVDVDNAARAMVPMAQLLEFQVTPASQRVLEDLLVASRCRLAIGADPRTRDLVVQVSAEHGRVSVTYLPRQQQAAQKIPEVIGAIDGVEEVLCTMATTNVMWIQERFDPHSQSLADVLQIAGRWNAAVELVQMVQAEEAAEPAPEASSDESPAPAPAPTADHGGILDDAAAEDIVIQDEGLRQTRDRLIAAGHAGGYRVVSDGPVDLLAGTMRTTPYSLVVVGDVFMSKIPSIRKRLRSELASYLSEQLRAPVIEADELRTQYLFGPAQWWRLLVFGAVAAVIVGLLLTHQADVLGFTSREGTGSRILAALCILILVPILAFSYGSFARYLLRLFRFE
jgi:cytidylate kinase